MFILPERMTSCVNSFKGCSAVGGGLGGHRPWYLVTELKGAGEVGKSRLPDENAFETIAFITEREFQLWRVAGHRGAMGWGCVPPVRAS